MKRFTQYLIEVAMSASDALATLGLKSGFTPDQLKQAYKKAATQNHPDRGGNTQKMQAVNAAREVLANLSHNTQDDDQEQSTNEYAPHPQTNDIRYMQIYEMFRRELNAEVRSKIGDGQIRVPLMKGSNSVKHNGNPVVIVISRQKNMLGTEYDVRGIFEVTKTMLKPLMRFNTSSYDRTVWESKRSVMWLMKKLLDLRNDDHLTRNNTIAEDAKKLQTLLDYYQKNQTKIDPNIK